MPRHTTLSFTRRYAPLFTAGCTVLLSVAMWPMLAKAIERKPILLRGLGNFQLPLIAVEIGLIIGASLVIGTGISFIIWLMKYEPVAEQ
ncbi:hypothetical protein [Spirosoma oryzae]|nr:hypothetical protein [Spirosoma oryzae]